MISPAMSELALTCKIISLLSWISFMPRDTTACQVSCPAVPAVGPSPGTWPLDLSGVEWPELCIQDGNSMHFFAIGDWGGIGSPPRTFDNTKYKRKYIPGADTWAQLNVASQMKKVAAEVQPQYIINVGDNFYPGGIETYCGSSGMCTVDGGARFQWEHVFEKIYDSPELKNAPWMGVLGNHDWGGWQFNKGWDQSFAYTWHSHRWITPAPYWQRRVQYCDFSVDFFFVDTNVDDVFQPDAFPNTNICSRAHNFGSCASIKGPSDPEDCVQWFRGLWKRQAAWLEPRLQQSDADWQIIVTHFPPDYNSDYWRGLASKYGIDLIITGHRHQQEVHYRDSLLGDTAWIVSGGGGGITSEGHPYLGESQNVQQYGFMDLEITKERLVINPHSFTGRSFDPTIVYPRARQSLRVGYLRTPTTTTTPVSASSLAPQRGSACSLTPACAHLSGNCCPTSNGLFLGCCEQHSLGQDDCSASRRRSQGRRLLSSTYTPSVTYLDEEAFDMASGLATENCLLVCGNRTGKCDACGFGKACCKKDDPAGMPKECRHIFGKFLTDHHECVSPQSSSDVDAVQSSRWV